MGVLSYKQEIKRLRKIFTDKKIEISKSILRLANKIMNVAECRKLYKRLLRLNDDVLYAVNYKILFSLTAEFQRIRQLLIGLGIR